MQCLVRNAAVGSKRLFVNQAAVNSLTINTHAVDLTQQSSITLGYVRYASRKHIELHIIDPCRNHAEARENSQGVVWLPAAAKLASSPNTCRAAALR